MILREGDRVRIKSGNQEGTGVVTHLFRDDTYPVGVIHDEDSDWNGKWTHAEETVYLLKCKKHEVKLIYSTEREEYFCPFCN